jgi:hypothetical protein
MHGCNQAARYILTGVLAAAVAISAPVRAAEPAFYVRVDGTFYAATQGHTLASPGSLFVDVITALVTQCRRPGGGYPEVEDIAVALGNVGFELVYAQTVAFHHTVPLVVSITTPTNDVTCSGAVTPPASLLQQLSQPPGSVIFFSGFEH